MSTALVDDVTVRASQPSAADGSPPRAAAASDAVPRLGGWLRLQIVSTLVGGTLLLCSLAAGWLWKQPFFAALPAALAVLLLGGPLVAAAARDLVAGKAGMNALVALAVIGAMASGNYQEAAAVAFFMIVSSLIEKRTAAGAEASIESLIRLAPTKASRLVGGVQAGDRGTEEEEQVEATQLRPGDLVRVRPGDTIPADGKVIRGASTVNQASITGESVPAEKAQGDDVFGSTINLTGVLDIEVTKAGADTLLGRVKDLILQAERTRTPIMRLVDEYAAWYTPTILMLVGVVLFFALKSQPDTAFNRAIAMLVIACPSALILATPTAMVAALSAAARLGVLVKSVATLEAARNVTAIVFDKTGTVTSGVLTVTRLAPAEGIEPAELLRLAASAAQTSRHPVARAVTEMARRARVALDPPSTFEEVAGRGVVASFAAGDTVLVGRASWLADAGAAPHEIDPAALERVQSSSEADGLSVLHVVVNGRYVGWIGLEDNARPEAAGAVDRLKSMGIARLVLLTGDRSSVAKRVAGQMHFDDYKAEVLPHEKLEMVDALKAAGHRVAVIGDGVNDAPALAAGDVSIAMGAAGSDVAIHSASIALLNSNLDRIPFLIDLSRRTISVIRQNMIIGGLFIIGFVSLAGAGYVSPVLAAALHVVSGLAVVFNSARLVRCGEEIEQAEAAAGRV
ncbi:MAG: heavy metal translocating P-type ATPase [Planctomycetia bacterium]